MLFSLLFLYNLQQIKAFPNKTLVKFNQLHSSLTESARCSKHAAHKACVTHASV